MLSGSAGSNVGFIAVMFDPWQDRKTPPLSQPGILAALRSQFNQISEAMVFAFVPPPIDGLGSAGGFQMEIEDTGIRATRHCNRQPKCWSAKDLDNLDWRV